jgi:hypothetical protein
MRPGLVRKRTESVGPTRLNTAPAATVARTMKPSADESAMAFQFGRLCREVFADARWEDCEQRVRRHWEGIRGEATWDRARDRILQGWLHGPTFPGADC